MADQTSSYADLQISGNRPIFQYDILAKLNAMSLYDLSEGLDTYLDLAREIILSDNYFYQGKPFPVIPQGQLFTLEPYETFSGTIVAPAYSFIVSMTHYTNQSEGFRLSVYDKGAKTDLFYNKFAKDITGSAQMGPNVDPHPATVSTEALEAFQAQGPRFIEGPMVILPPGTLQIELTNLSPNQNLAQVLFNFAVPMNGPNTNIVNIKSHGNEGS